MQGPTKVAVKPGRHMMEEASGASGGQGIIKDSFAAALQYRAGDVKSLQYKTPVHCVGQS